MKGNKEILGLLNQGLGLELTAVHQYLAQSKLCEHWGYHRLAAHFYADYADERSHAEALLSRILFLEGVPDLQVAKPVFLGRTIQEQIEADLKLESQVVQFYNEVIAACARLKDAGSRELADFLLKSSEEDVKEFESQLKLIKQIGLENYAIEMIGNRGDGKKD